MKSGLWCRPARSRALTIALSCSGTRKARWCRAASLRDNPQNVDNPLVLPCKDRDAGAAVEVQLEALQNNNEPWPNHGIHTMYEFAEDVGGLDRSKYFGRSLDLYHMDHFQGHFGTSFKDVIDHTGFTIGTQVKPAPGFTEVCATVEGAEGPVNLLFIMKIKDIGRNKGCWMTACLKRVVEQDE